MHVRNYVERRLQMSELHAARCPCYQPWLWSRQAEKAERQLRLSLSASCLPFFPFITLTPSRPLSCRCGLFATMESSHSTTIPSFDTLPDELQLCIIELACLLPAPTPSPSSAAAPPTTPFIIKPSVDPPLDLATAFALLTVSKGVYKLALPVLYRSVTLSRPSALAFFFRTLYMRPELGKLLRTLRVGDATLLPTNRPLPFDKEALPFWTIQSSLCRAEEAQLLPVGLKPGDRWPLLSAAGTDRRSQAIHRALAAIQGCLGIDLRREEFDMRVLTPTWRVFMHEAQAAFDLYLMAMRRCEDDGCSAFPQLRLTGYRYTLLAQVDGYVHTLDRVDILCHIARPGGTTDHFEHNLVYARSGINVVRSGCGFPQREDEAHFTVPLDTPLPRTASGELITKLCLDILDHTPHLKALILFGYLEEAVRRSHFLLPSSLRYLSIGPCLSWTSSKPLSLRNLGGLKQLCIRNMESREVQIQDVFAKLPGLKTLTLHWSLPRPNQYMREEKLAR